MPSAMPAAHLESVLHPQDVHVLLVDDEQLSRLVVGNLLRKCDYKVTVVESGAQALDVLQRSLPGTFQLILTDVMMPDVNGLDILRYVRSNTQLADLPVIMMSANERKDAVFEAIRGGAEEYLVKPVTKKEVQNIWQHVWKRLSAAKLLREQQEADLQADDATAAAALTGTQPSSNNSSLDTSQQQQVQQRQLLQSMQQLHCASQVVQQPDPLAPGQQRRQTQQQQHQQQLPQQQRQRVALSQWLQRPKRSVNAKESIWLFCEVLLLLQDMAAATAGSNAARLPAGVVRPSRLLLHSNGRVTAAAATAAVDAQEEAAYRSPDESPAAAAAAATVDAAHQYSYSLGVLLFDLLYAAPGGPAGRFRALAELRQRVMPPAFLQAHPQEAALVLSLLRPEPAARPSLQQLVASELLSGVCEVLLQRRRQLPAPVQDTDSLVFFLQTMHGRKEAEVQQAQAGVAALDAQIAAVEAALRQAQQGGQQQQQQHLAEAAGQQLDVSGAGSSAAAMAAAAALPAAPPAAAMEVDQQQQPVAASAAADDSSDDEMERRESSRNKRRRVAATPPSAVEQFEQQLLERSGSANSGVAAAAASNGDAEVAAATPAVVSQWERVADRFPVLEGVYDKHRRSWEQQQPQQDGVQQQQAADLGEQQQQQEAATPAIPASSSCSGSRKLPGYLQAFGEDLWAFSRYRGMAVRGTVRAAADVLGGGSAMVATAAFDRDDEYLATAGVSKRIRIFEYAAITSSACGGGYGCAAATAPAPGVGGVSGGSFGGGGPLSPGRNGTAAPGGAGGADGVVYPVLELSTRSRLSCVAWSSYVKAHLASSDHEGVVTLWDANTGGELVQFEEHSKRAWAVDFSRLEPTRLVSCSDDSTVKLWSVHDEGSLATLQLHANVCSVQFSPESPHLLACGCANYRTYLFDLRKTAQALAYVQGHRRAVSYVRWLGGEQLVTASTDNTLKLWSVPALAAASSGEAPASAASSACLTTYTGHLNQRNFIGLAVLPGAPGESSSTGLGGGVAYGSSGSSSRPLGGYMVCGSETNEVCVYHTSMPVPVAAHSFSWPAGGGAERSEGSGGGGGVQQQGDNFVSCVAWNRRQGTIVAGNSAGHIKVLELV